MRSLAPCPVRAILRGLLPAAALLTCVAPAAPAAAQAPPGAALMGRVLNGETGLPVPDVMVQVEGSDLGALTDSLGRYRIPHVPPGPRVLRVRRIGFAVVRVAVSVPARGTVRRDIELAVDALEMEDMIVTADAASRARGELGTASVIERDAIEHLTATSLAGILELVPGGEISRPGLDDVEQVSLRQVPTSSSLFASGADGGARRTAAELAAFGTLIVLDGVPLSNNANLQTLGPRGDLPFTTSAGGGVDLRRIPANTIERVEVIRGLPSVRYGDLTQGAIIVETRAATVTPVFSGKYDARTGEGSMVGGRTFGDGEDQALTLTFDVARTRTDPGLSDDVSSRLSTQLAHRATLGRKETPQGPAPRLLLDTRLDLFQLIDDRPENPDVRPGREFRSRDRGFRLSERAELRLWGDARLRLTGALDVLQQSSFSRAPRVSGTQPFTDRETEGRAEGRYIGGFYSARVDVDGEPWLAYGRLELEDLRSFLGASHAVRVGTEFRREWNSGPGYQFDPRFPPQVDFNGIRGYDRPRTYDAVPPLVTSGLYAGDRVTGRVWGLSASLQAGLRLDLLHEGGSWLYGVRDALLQPRLNVELQPERWLRLRGGWGLAAKAPSLADLYPAPQYFDLVNVNYFTEDPAERLAVLTTFIEDPTNPDLGLSRGNKAEVGLEVGLGEGAVSLVAFRDEVEGAVGIAPEPDFLLRDRFALTDSVTGNGIPPEIVEPPRATDTIPVLIQRPANVFDVLNEGLELSATLPEVEPVHTRLQVNAAWVRTEKATEALHFGSGGDFNAFQQLADRERTPYWGGATERGERAIALYRIIHHQPEVGLVVTGTIQHNVLDRIRDVTGTDTLSFAGYVTRDARLVPVPPERRGDPEFADLRQSRGGAALPRETAADWMASVRVSKSLPLGGKLSFWAFNFLYRRGSRAEIDVAPRNYPAPRFGLELTVPTREWLSW